MPREIKNVGASVRARLLLLAQRHGADFQLIVTRYALERFLYRLGVSPYRDRFILKGAMLFTIWLDDPYRPTRDVDFLGFGENETEAVAKIFREVCAAEVADDGVVFDVKKLRAESTREDTDYGGVRVQTQATVGGARVPIRVDIGFGDVVTPRPAEIEYPVLLDAPPPKLRAYPKETVVAEKFEALVSLGHSNSRMKDFYDLWMLSRHFEFEQKTLEEAVRATFQRRGTDLPDGVPTGLSDSFASAPDKTKQWNAFVTRDQLKDIGPLSEVVAQIRPFLMPVAAGALDEDQSAVWPPGGPWRSK